jgi:hypothetical protein
MVKVWTIEEISQNKIVSENGVQKVIPLTDAEKQAKLEKWNSWEAKAPDRKLAEIKQIRLQKLMETDYLANSDVTMPDNIKTWRQSLRDIPQDFSTEEQYDLLLARDEQGNLTHSIWSKP